MAKQDELVESTPIGTVARRPKPSLTTGVDELVTGVNDLRKKFQADAAARAGGNQPSALQSILSGGGLVGASPTRGPTQFVEPSPTAGAAGGFSVPNPSTPSPRASGAEDLGSFKTFQATDPMYTTKTVSDARAAATLPPGRGSPAGSRRMASDFADPRLVSPNVLANQRAQQNAGPFNIEDPYGSPVVTQRGRVEGSYGSLGGTPLTANYDRAGEAARVQGRLNDASRFVESQRGAQRENNLRRRANARLSGDMGIVDFAVAAGNRKNAQAELTQLLGESGKDRRAQLTADTSRANTQDTQAGALTRSLISEQGDTDRAQAAQRATASLEAYKQGQSNFRTTLKEIASTDRKTMEINSKEFLAQFKSNDEFLQATAKELDMTQVGLKQMIIQGVLPVLNQKRAEQGKEPLDPGNPAAWNGADLVAAASAAAQFRDRARSSREFFGDPAVDAESALNLGTENAYGVLQRRRNDNSKD